MMSKVKNPTIIDGILPLIVLVVGALLSILVWDTNMLVPLMLSIVTAAIIAIRLGHPWTKVEGYMVNGVRMVLSVVFILMIIGALVGTWILSGTIPTLIFYGLNIINPSFFLPMVAIIAGILTLVLGNGFITAGTVGIAFMVIGQGMGFPAEIVAAAVVTGGLMGDKLSPLCDTTITAPAIVDTDVYSHIKHMLWDTLPAYFISVIIFWFIGNKYASNTVNLAQLEEITANLANVFTITPVLFLLPIITLILIVKKFPVIPVLTTLALLGGIASIIFQGSSVALVVQTMTNGYVADTNIELLDTLLTQGGIVSMSGIILLVVFATALGGIYEGAGLFSVLLDKMIEKAKSVGALISATIFSGLLIGFSSGALYLAIILPGRALVGTYKERGLDTKNLSRCLETVGSVGIYLVPWGVPILFVSSVLGVDPIKLIPYLFFAFLVPIINIVYGFTGFTIAKKDYPETIKPREESTTPTYIAIEKAID